MSRKNHKKKELRGWGLFFSAEKCTTAALSQFFMRAKLGYHG